MEMLRRKCHVPQIQPEEGRPVFILFRWAEGESILRNIAGLAAGAVLVSALSFAALAYGQAPPATKAVSSTPSVSEVPSGTPDPVTPARDANTPVDITLDPSSLVPDLPPIPKANATLIGGTIEHINLVQDEITIRVFGGGKMKALFDPRTKVERDGKKASIEDLKNGQRIYADTILLNGTVFARNIRLSGSSTMGESQGIVVAYRGDKNVLVLHDQLSPAPMNLQLTSGTRVTRGNQAASTSDLVPGALVSVNFVPQPGNRPVARQVAILITPGTEFTFNGRVTALDLHLGLLVVTSTADNRMYEIHFDPATLPISPDLHEGAEISVKTRYEQNQYVARGLTVKKNPAN